MDAKDFGNVLIITRINIANQLRNWVVDIEGRRRISLDEGHRVNHMWVEIHVVSNDEVGTAGRVGIQIKPTIVIEVHELIDRYQDVEVLTIDGTYILQPNFIALCQRLYRCARNIRAVEGN